MNKLEFLFMIINVRGTTILTKEARLVSSSNLEGE